MFVQTENIIAIVFTNNVIPNLVILEEQDEKDKSFSYLIYDIACTRRRPKQWFIDQGSNSEYHLEIQMTKLPFDSLYTSPPAIYDPNPPYYYWLKPGIEVVVEDPEDIWQLRSLQRSVRLPELPRSFSLTTLTKILGEAYDGLFYWCYECQDYESFKSEEHSNHTSMWLSESDGRKGYFCPMCRKYRLTCRHGKIG